LWWLAALTFDLAFIWHLFVRHEAAQRYIEERLRTNQKESAAKDAAAPS
jgi:hypothetical protein